MEHTLANYASWCRLGLALGSSIGIIRGGRHVWRIFAAYFVGCRDRYCSEFSDATLSLLMDCAPMPFIGALTGAAIFGLKHGFGGLLMDSGEARNHVGSEFCYSGRAKYQFCLILSIGTVLAAGYRIRRTMFEEHESHEINRRRYDQ